MAGGVALAAGGADEAGYFQRLDGGAGDVDALGVGAGVWRGEQEAGAEEQGAVVGGEAFEQVAVVEGEAEPDAGGAGPSGEALVEEALGAGGVGGGVGGGKVANVTDPLDLLPGDSEDLAGEVEDLQLGRVRGEAGGGVAGAPVPGELAHNHGFAERGHCFGLSHGGGIAGQVCVVGLAGLGQGRGKLQSECNRP